MRKFPINMERVAGKHVGSYLCIHEGYIYYRYRRYAGNSYRCRNRRTGHCNRQAATIYEEVVIILAQHNHHADPNLCAVYRFKDRLLEESKKTNKSLCEIFNTFARTWVNNIWKRLFSMSQYNKMLFSSTKTLNRWNYNLISS